jgi:hypothetical protein
MKKSEIYHLAQIAVINSPSISPESKIEVMRILLEDESLALFVEDREAKEAMNEPAVVEE